MKRYVYSSDDTFKKYKVEVSLYRNKGYLVYEVGAINPTRAEERALELAWHDVSAYSAEPTDNDNEYDITIALGGGYGVMKNYTVYGRSQYDAEQEAIEQARNELVAECVTD